MQAVMYASCCYNLAPTWKGRSGKNGRSTVASGATIVDARKSQVPKISDWLIEIQTGVENRARNPTTTYADFTHLLIHHRRRPLPEIKVAADGGRAGGLPVKLGARTVAPVEGNVDGLIGNVRGVAVAAARIVNARKWRPVTRFAANPTSSMRTSRLVNRAGIDDANVRRAVRSGN